MVPFNYSRISRKLISELNGRLLDAESLLLLGSRFVGKRHVMHRLREQLKQAGGTVLKVKFLVEPPLTSEWEVSTRLERTVRKEVGRLPDPPEGISADILFAPLDYLVEETRRKNPPQLQKPVFLIASNVDSLAHHVARSFLEGLRARIELGDLICILSGEDDLQYLVQSPKGGFNCAHQYVLQDYDYDLFSEYLFQYAATMNIKFASRDGAAEAHALWELTGGNIYVMRMVLWGVIQSRIRPGASGGATITVADLPQSLDVIGIPGVYGAHVFRHGTQLIERDPDCWDELEVLKQTGRVKLGVEAEAPKRLEMAGVARRVLEPRGAYLEFVSPLQAAFVKTYYTDRRFGDLYAGAARWDQAFARYAILESGQMMRPLGVNDRTEVEMTVKALCSALYAEAAKHKRADDAIHAIKNLFAKGCRYLLGFSEISFWLRDPSPDDAAWKPSSEDEFPPTQGVKDRIASLLPKERQAQKAGLEPDSYQVPTPWNQFLLVKLLPAARADQQSAVAVSDLGKSAYISHSRETLALMLLDHFEKAYTHSNAMSRLQDRLNVRERHVRTMNAIFRALGSDVRDVNHVLEKAAKGLRKLGYRRAFFSLVDPEEQRIEGFLDDCEDNDVDLAQMVNLPLREHDTNLQPYVIKTREPYRVPDASREPRADPRLVREARLSAFALVPILTVAGQNRTDRAIGTIHVERADGAVPSEAEIDDLLSFGRQLAVAVEQSERVNMLESALGKIPEPIVIVDRAQRRRYANRPAADLFHVRESWEPAVSDRQRFGEEAEGAEGLAALVSESLSGSHRLATHFKGAGADPEYRGAALTDVILNWQGRVSGGLLHIQDFNYLHRVFEAAQLLAGAQDTPSAMQSMLEVARTILGLEWGRLYLTDEEDPSILVSKLSFGYPDPQIEKKFNSGGVHLASSDEAGSIDWQSFVDRKPIVFCWKDELPRGAIYVTPHGLKAVNAPDPLQPEEIKKHPGDFWIDFPLVAGDRVLGKLCLQCDEKLRPEDFELLTLLSEIVVRMFEGFLRRAETSGAREQMIMVSTAEKTVGTIAHNLATRFGALPPLRGRYWLLERKYPELVPINRDFRHVVNAAMATAQRAKELLGPVNPHWTSFDLVGHLERTLRSALPAEAWAVEAGRRPLSVMADAHLLETALMEMVQNSKDILGGEREPRITLLVETVVMNEEPQEWVKLTYRDDGPGFPPELGEKIFEEFYSYRPGQSTGTGLGLVFVRRVIKAHDGFIYAGLPSRGAEFIIGFRTQPARKATKEEADVSHSYS